MSFGRMALEELNIPVEVYYSSEIDKYATQATQALFPDVVQLGDVTQWQDWEFMNVGFNLGDIDLLLAGFPCQAWSLSGKQKGDNDPRGALVHDLINIWKQINLCRAELGKEPVKFMFENVKMKKEFLNYINNLFGVEPICINSALVSAQNRTRYYWTNIEGIEQPEDEGIMLKDIIEHGGEYTYMSDRFINRQQGRKCLRDDLDGKAVNLSAMEYVKNGRQGDYIKCGSMVGRKINPATGKRDDYNPDIKTVQRIEVRSDEKTGTITTVQKDNLVVINNETVDSKGKSYALTASYMAGMMASNSVERKQRTLQPVCETAEETNQTHNGIKYRKLTPTECFRLQTVPQHHIDTLLNSGISNTQLYKMCGNGWTHNVITHIFKGLA